MTYKALTFQIDIEKNGGDFSSMGGGIIIPILF